MIGLLIYSFPTLEDKVNEAINWSGGKSNHIIFSQVFNPYIKQILIEEVYNRAEKEKVVQFLENMAISNDCCVREVLTDSILEELLDCPDEFDKIEAHLLEKTKSYLPPIKKFFEYDERKNL